MSSPSDVTRGHSAFYEKMLVADAFLIIGCILLSFGLGLSFYRLPISAQDSVDTLATSNGYSQNYTFYLDQADRFVLGVKPYALANVTLILSDPSSLNVVDLQASEAGAFLNFTYLVDAGGEYRLRVFENISNPSNRAVICQLEVMSVVFLANPAMPYVFYGIAAIAIGLTCLLFSKRNFPKTRDPDEWYEPRGYALSAILLVSTVGFAWLFSTGILFGSSQLGVLGDVLLVAFSALNLFSWLVGITTLQSKPLDVFLKVLFMSIAVWLIAVIVLVVLLPSFFLQSTPYWDLGVFLSYVEDLATLNVTFVQVETVAMILVIACCLSYGFGKYRIYSHQINTELLEAGTLRGLMRELEGSLGKRNLEEFFKGLRGKDLEASVFLFYLLSDHLNTGANSFTYHGIIADRRDVFSKDIYERDPAQEILQPLGFLKVSGKGRFKNYRLQINRPIVIRLTSLFRGNVERGEKESLAKWAGADLLKERRMRYAGQLREKDESPQ
ncbi:MAG: hypothetical protein WED04_06885 [Promethearchaeati archaeon SRVP18_Atabeyarchaeia-1]